MNTGGANAWSAYTAAQGEQAASAWPAAAPATGEASTDGGTDRGANVTTNGETANPAMVS